MEILVRKPRQNWMPIWGYSYVEARNRDGGNYSRSTLLGFRNGLEHYLNSPPYKKCIQIATDPASRQSNQMLDAKLKKKLKKPTIEREDLRRLKERSPISYSSKMKTTNDTQPWPMTSQAKHAKGGGGRGLDDTATNYEKLGRIYQYQADHRNGGYNALRLYCSKLNPDCNAFFQFPKRFWKGPEESVWFENRCLGANKLGSMMTELSKAAHLSQVYTNHCISATVITLWSDVGLSNRHIKMLSDHRNENYLKSYSARPSS